MFLGVGVALLWVKLLIFLVDRLCPLVDFVLIQVLCQRSDSAVLFLIAISVIVVHRYNAYPASMSLGLIVSRASAMDYNNLNCYNGIGNLVMAIVHLLDFGGEFVSCPLCLCKVIRFHIKIAFRDFDMEVLEQPPCAVIPVPIFARQKWERLSREITC
ncbi:MAG: hypothetical protein LBB40_00160 [Holophagales bacterium]|nr:hypothetical protein [Holophagales bacterium]